MTNSGNVLPVLVEECLGVPLVARECQGRAVRTGLSYAGGEDDDDGREEEDEVEDMFRLLQIVQRQYPSVDAVNSGAILSTYQRVRVEDVCARLSLTPLSYLWRVGPQEGLLRCMLEDGLEAVLVKTAAPGLVPRQHLNRTLGELSYCGGVFQKLYERFRFQQCGEGGEYETLVLDCALFAKKKLVLDEVEVVYPDGNPDELDDKYNLEGKVGLLNIVSYHAHDKTDEEIRRTKELLVRIHNQKPLPLRIAKLDDNEDSSSDSIPLHDVSPRTTTTNDTVKRNNITHATITTTPTASLPTFLPHVKSLPGGLVHFSEMFSSSKSSSSSLVDTATAQFLDVLSTLRRALHYHHLTPQDVVYVHLYLADMAHFVVLNRHYQAFFGSVLPPSRSCVGIGSHDDGHPLVLLDVCALRHSGRSMRRTTTTTTTTSSTNTLRSVLHVQSRSHWAPVCVGPYSQTNTLRESLVMLAGQIGLHPPTMSHGTTTTTAWHDQLRRCWTNAASVLDSLSKGTLQDCLGALVYLSSSSQGNNYDDTTTARDICRYALATNGGVVAGYVDDDQDEADGTTNKFGGYEDEETYQEMMNTPAAVKQEQNDEHQQQRVSSRGQEEIPILFVFIPQMPVGSLAEVELVCGTRKAVSSIGIETAEISSSDVGGEGSSTERPEESQAGVRWNCGYDDQTTTNWDTSIAAIQHADTNKSVEVKGHVRFLKACCAMAWMTVHRRTSEDDVLDVDRVLTVLLGRICRAARAAGLNRDHVLHIRLYCLAGHDPRRLRTALAAAIGRRWGGSDSISSSPASTVVPVGGFERNDTLFAAQVTMNDLVHTETEMWIHHGREY